MERRGGRATKQRQKPRQLMQMERMFGMGRMAMFGRQLDRSQSWWERTAALATGSTHWPRATGNWQLEAGNKYGAKLDTTEAI